MKEFCPYCSKITKNKFVTREKKINVRGETISVTYKARMCTECGDFFYIVPKDEDPFDKAYRIYRKNHNLTQPEDIKKLRKKYGLTQAELGNLLGWGAVTLSRYENGALQDEAHQKIITLIERNPENLLILIEENHNLLSRDRVDKIRNQIQDNNMKLKHIYPREKVVLKKEFAISPARWNQKPFQQSVPSIRGNKKIYEFKELSKEEVA